MVYDVLQLMAELCENHSSIKEKVRQIIFACIDMDNGW